MAQLRWTPDDRFVLAEGFGRDDKGHVYQIDVQSGRTTLLADLSAEGDTTLLAEAQDPEPAAVAILQEAQAIRKRVRETAPDAMALNPVARWADGCVWQLG